MRSVFPFLTALLLSLLLSACDSGAGVDAQEINFSLAVDDTLRSVRFRIPESLSPGDPAQVLIAFHGSRDSGPAFQRGAGLDGLAGNDLIIAYPTAAKGNWAEGCNCNIADRLGINDLGFVDAMLDTLANRYQVHRERTFAVGFSQGGLFTYRLACERGDRFKAVAAVAAPMSEPLSETCAAENPVSVMTLHGREDGVLPWDGTDAGALSLLSAPETAFFWSKKLSCETSARAFTDSKGARLPTSEYEDCRGDSRVRLFEIPRGSHQWYTNGPDSRRLVLEFFGL